MVCQVLLFSAPQTMNRFSFFLLFNVFTFFAYTRSKEKNPVLPVIHVRHGKSLGKSHSGDPYGPLCAPVRSHATSVPHHSQPPGQQQVSQPHCHYSCDPLILSLCPIAITSWPQETFCMGWQTAHGTEQVLSNPRCSLPLLHVSSIGTEMDQINDRCLNGDQ